MVTIKDIAKKLGISISTVSKGMNGASDISADTRQLVLDTALEMGYIGKRTKNSLSKHVCIVILHLPYSNIDEYGYELISGFRLAATENNYMVSMVSIDDLQKAHKNYDTAMEMLGYHGAFFVGLTKDDAYLEQLQSTKIPTILFEEPVQNPCVGTIGVNVAEGIQQCVSYLHEQGHRRIAFINGLNNCAAANMRMEGYRRGLDLVGLPFEERLTGSALFYPPDSVKDFIPVFLEEKATAIVCGNDYIAAAALSELMQRGLRVPTDISITGFDDNPVAKYLSPPLTTINENRLGIGRTALIMLDNLIRNGCTGVMLTHPKLIVRKSTGKYVSQRY